MKVLIFTHKSDIDGMGGAVLANLAFESCDYHLVETFNLQEELRKYYENNKIYEYDRIYITDIWLEEPSLTKVAEDPRLKDKVFIFDHHESALKEGYNKYPFAHIEIKNDLGLCSGTSLFYNHLIKEGFLQKEDKQIAEFVELTRRYDTWEWKTKYNDEHAHELTLLFDSVGTHNYIRLMTDKLRNKKDKFSFNEIEDMIITSKKDQAKNKVDTYISKMMIKEVLGFKAGIIFIDYEYRNDIAEELRSRKIDIDFVMLIVLEYGTISFRSIKENVNVRKIAEVFGGKGHDKAASCPIRKEQISEILEILLKNNCN